MRNRFDSQTRISKYTGPLLQTHGTRDRVVPFYLGERLFESAGTDPVDKEFVVRKNGNHNDPLSKVFHQQLESFLDKILEPVN